MKKYSKPMVELFDFLLSGCAGHNSCDIWYECSGCVVQCGRDEQTSRYGSISSHCIQSSGCFHWSRVAMVSQVSDNRYILHFTKSNFPRSPAICLDLLEFGKDKIVTLLIYDKGGLRCLLIVADVAAFENRTVF